MKGRLVFYVHRTGLLSYFVIPICEYLLSNYHITILHLDKRNGYHYASQAPSFFELIDLSDKNVREIQQLLFNLHPLAFISLGFISIYELLMLRICKKANIYTIFLEHGLYSKETSTLPMGKLIHKFGSTVSKNLYFLRCYWQFIRRSGLPLQEISIFWCCIKKKEYYLSKFDKALFFAEYGRKQISTLFHYEESEVDYICYPLAPTDIEYERYKKISTLPLASERRAIFIHQPFILDGLAQWSYDDERDYFVGIANNLKEYGYSLSIQLHPRSDIDMYQQLYEDTDIELIQGMERSSFKKYALALGHYSTALLYPIFFRIPVVLVDYPGVCKAEDSVFRPVSCTLPVNNMDALIENYKKFSEEYLGVGMCSFENIARKLTETIEKIK